MYGRKPKVDGVDIFGVSLNNPKFEMVSGIKYLTEGTFDFYIDDIDHLNNTCAAPTKIELSSKIFKEPYVYNPIDLSNYSLDYDLHDVRFEKEFVIADNLINTTEPIVISGKVYNAFGYTEFETEFSFLLNTMREDDNAEHIDSTDLIEYFDSENKRLQNNRIREWNSADALNAVNGLMVIPNTGLCYPYGDYTAVYPENNNRNYSDMTEMCYYVRKFKADDDNLRFGGTFVFDNLTKAEFEKTGFTLKLSIDNGKSWLDCKKDRQIYEEIYDDNGLLTELIADGVLGKVEEFDNQLHVTFGLNKSYYAGTVTTVDGDIVVTTVAGDSVKGNTGIIMRLRNE